MATRRLRRCSALLIAAIAVVAAADGPLTQVTAVEREGRVALFAVVGRGTDYGIVRAELEGAVVPYSAFFPIGLHFPLSTPLLASDGEQLVVIDAYRGRILELDASGNIRNMLFTSRADAVHALGLSAHYVALASPMGLGIVLLDRRRFEPFAFVETAFHVRTIERLEGDRFLVTYLETPRVDELRFSSGAWSLMEIGETPHWDVAQHQGIFYVLRDGQVTIHKRSAIDDEVVRMIFTPEADSIAVTRDWLLLTERGGERVRAVDRLEPITVSAEDIDGQNGAALVAIYQYLARHDLTRQLLLEARSFDDLDDVLQATASGAPWWEHTFLTGAQRDALAAVLCKVNGRDCASVASLLAWLTEAKPERFVAPQLSVKLQQIERTKTLPQENTAAYIASLPAEARGSVTAADILRANPGLFGSFEHEILSRGFALFSSAIAGFRAGSGVQYEEGRPRGVTLRCTTANDVVYTSIDLPKMLETQRAVAVLPPIRRQLSAERIRSYRGTQRIRVAFDQAILASLGDGEWMANCPKSLAEGVDLVSHTITLTNVRYQLLDQQGEVIQPTAEDLRGLNLDLRVEGEWLVPRARAHLDVGYRAVHFTPEMTDATPFDDAVIRRDKAPLRLPVPAWLISTVARSRDLENEQSPLYAIQRAYVFDQRVRGAASGVEQADDPPLEDATPMMQSNRTKVLSAIHYPSAASTLFSSAIGVAEKCESTDFQHPDFGTGNVYAWAPDVPQCPKQFSVDRRVKTFSVDQDHGSHVAGLIGARPGSPITGLLPKAKLSFIEYKEPGTFSAGVEAALRQQSTVISCSFTWGFDGLPLKQGVLRKLEEIPEWHERLLFVVAAGNCAQPMHLAAGPPASWMPFAKRNILNVGASDFSHRRFQQWVPGPGPPECLAGGEQVLVGTNFGKDLVELFAPGEKIMSTASGGSYAEASGSSQAVPLVAATAALLSRELQSPEKIKARLLYTADWWSSLGDDVWAGELNAERALRSPTENLCATHADRNEDGTYPYARLRVNPTDRIEVRGKGRGRTKPGEPAPPVPSSLAFQDVLRIQWHSETASYRIFYREMGSGLLQIIENARIRGLLACDDPRDPLCDANGQFDVTAIYDYVGASPQGNVFF